MSVKQYLTPGDYTKIDNAVNKNRPMSMAKQKMAEKQEKMFYDLSKDSGFQGKISGLKRMDKIIAIQKKYAQNGVQIARQQVSKMIKDGVTIAKPPPISMSKPIVMPVVIPKVPPKIVSVPKEIVPEIKPILEEVDNILDYQIYDVNGFIGAFATTSDLKQLREFVFKLDGSIALKELFETGASLITQELVDDISIIKSDNRAIQKIITILQKAIDKADTMVIISDGE